MRYYKEMESPIGQLTLIEEEETLKEILFENQNIQDADRKSTSFLEMVEEQLKEYFEGKRRTFSFSISPQGTEFQRKVWKALEGIPYGEVKTYGQIASEIGSPKGSRAVGMANHNNPIPIVIPCHRVIGKNGSLTGYAGGLEKKTALLTLERSGDIN
ncbi:MAG: methylated-DNA--[protein]-cysteine S-methyltransferase [Clostridia bacterium]|nr:methylated-DNA--[protein]-cysteine S-methyltransferase [Clostridia bacterium]NCC43469.1 methylated-DNA--[protein]-cysteine S-methyltransferase [Clostridia bacterium]